ncbi:hypothetical protein VTO73DRAFT_12804 [Trametes versicolor]
MNNVDIGARYGITTVTFPVAATIERFETPLHLSVEPGPAGHHPRQASPRESAITSRPDIDTTLPPRPEFSRCRI